MNIREHLSVTRDFFAYAVAFFDSYPEKHRMTSHRAVSELITSVETAQKTSKNQTTKHWLALSLQELHLAKEVLDSGKVPEAEKHLRTAETFFEDAYRGRRLVTDFIVGSEGTVRRAEAGENLSMRDSQVESVDEDAT